MLTDTARKVLRMLDAHRYVPSVKEIARKAGRREWQVRAALHELHQKEHIVYDPANHDAVRVILAWDIDAEAERKRKRAEAERRYLDRELYPGRY